MTILPKLPCVQAVLTESVSVFYSRAVFGFESLESLEWTLDLSSCARDNNELLQNLDVMENMVCRECNVLSIVQAFQRRILRKDLTSVMVRTGDTTAKSDVIASLYCRLYPECFQACEKKTTISTSR